MIKFEASWNHNPIVIEASNSYSEKYVRKVLRDRLKKVFGHQNFILWIDRSRGNASNMYAFEITKMFDFGEGPLFPINKGALNNEQL